MDLRVCGECGEYVIDGCCGCEFVPGYERMLEQAEHDWRAEAYPGQSPGTVTFERYLARHGYAPEVIALARAAGLI